MKLVMHSTSQGPAKILVTACAWLIMVTGSSAADVLTFERDIRPILRAHCFDCHGATDAPKAGLDLRQVRLMQKGGESGTAIVPGIVDESLLVQRVRSGEMPPGETKLTPKEIASLTTWIADGAQTARPEPENIAPGPGITPEERAFWSFQPVHRPTEPSVRPDVQGRIRTAIDAYLLAQMPEGLTFAEEAERLSLILRTHFDLTGLPPSADQLQSWVEDPSEDWFARLID